MGRFLFVSLLAWQLSGCAPPPTTSIPPPRAPEPVTTPNTEETAPVSLEDRAQAVFRAVQERDFETATAGFDDNLAKALTKERFEQVWQQTEQQHGTFVGYEAPVLEPKTKPATVLVRLNFERGGVLARVVFQPDQRIGGLAFEQVWIAPEYANPDAFVERDLSVGSEEWQLPATLTLPKSDKPVPGVVLVHGSGPRDRDSTLGPNKTFKDLAWGLASQGIAVLRYDKRTLIHRNKLEPVPNDFSVDDETVDDAVSALDVLRKQPEVAKGRVFVLGHSLGGQLTPRIASRDPAVSGLIILAGSARPMYETILEQAEYLSSLAQKPSPQQKAHLEFMKAEAQRLETLYRTGKPEAGTLLGTPRSYWVDLKDYDAPAVAAKLGKPVLVLQGGRDYQVTAADFALWRESLEGHETAKLTEYEALNHLFMAGVGKSQPGEYQRPGHVDAAVVADIVSFIKVSFIKP